MQPVQPGGRAYRAHRTRRSNQQPGGHRHPGNSHRATLVNHDDGTDRGSQAPMEGDETLDVALIREVDEETGLAITDIRE
jgi:8-oxo-dGTP pyrophosphatase MutT (NUDIX family)